ncbi:MAG: Zn-dependent oxidoreductase [Halobacteria archaeon]|nr:Zn-dependent oxidoreductase [Halobacteria archaeon]
MSEKDDAEELVPNYVGAEETKRGYVVRFNGADETLRSLAGFVAEELKCCSFADYTIDVEPPYDETRLRIEGPDGTSEVFEEFVERMENSDW